jgi:phosphoribosylglycinamide formyltransferase-1
MTAVSAQRIVVLISGRGSNAVALMAACENGLIDGQVVKVISDQADAAGLLRAEEYGVDTACVEATPYADRTQFERALSAAIDLANPTLLVLAGFMRVLSAPFLAPYAGRIINIHPSLLPRHRGLHTHARALDAGDARHGASIHFVTAELDGGPVISQAELAIAATDTADTLAERVLALEHRLLPATVALLSHAKVELNDETIFVHAKALASPLRLGVDLADDGHLIGGPRTA